ncbi:MAG: TolB protein [Puniceicoccaceae bacterium 5H]|nr:MAG: TolB protein [Puniceicoccaceae bacterium 5H]
MGLILLALVSVPQLHAQGQNIGDVRGKVDAKVLTVKLASNDGAVLDWVRQAFALHGGYQVKSDGRTQFDFRFERGQGSQITLIVGSGGKELLRQDFTGSSWADALAQAADYAVRRTLDLPGFFNSQIAFVSQRTGDREVYTSDLLFRQPRQLTSDGSECLVPDLAPDNSALLYTSYHRNGFPDIYRINLQTKERKVFASFRGINTGPAYSPSGRQVAMVLSGSGNSELYVANADGKNLERITSTRGLEADPSWSPDGNRIVYTSDEAGSPQIYVINANGRGARRVPTNISGNCSEPTWNPVDADKIALTAAAGGEFEVAVFSFSEGKSTWVTRGPGDAVHPIWLNDGRHLIYTQRTKQSARLMVLDTATGNSTPLSPSGFTDAEMADVIYLGK